MNYWLKSVGTTLHTPHHQGHMVHTHAMLVGYRMPLYFRNEVNITIFFLKVSITVCICSKVSVAVGWHQ